MTAFLLGSCIILFNMQYNSVSLMLQSPFYRWEIGLQKDHLGSKNMPEIQTQTFLMSKKRLIL